MTPYCYNTFHDPASISKAYWQQQQQQEEMEMETDIEEGDEAELRSVFGKQALEYTKSSGPQLSLACKCVSVCVCLCVCQGAC